MSTDYLPDLDVRHLVTLRAIAAAGSFHGAADRLEYTQSAVSQHVAALEGVLGVRLIDRGRGRRTVALTEAGELLVRHAEAIVARLHAARADVAAYTAGGAGTLRVGTFQSAGARIVPALVQRFAAAWPDVEIQLSESTNDADLLRQVEAGELDLAFAAFPIPPGPFETVELLRDPYVLVVRKDSPLAARATPPSAAEIAGLPLIGFRHCRSTAAVETHLRQNGYDPHFVFRSDQNQTVQAMVVAGVGAALVPVLTVDSDDPEVSTLPTDVPARVVALAWHRDRYRSAAARAFTGFAGEVSAELALGPTAAGSPAAA